MRLSRLAIMAIRGGGYDAMDKLGKALGVSDKTAYRYVATNESNGDLTKAIALKTIKEITGLDDSQLLEESETEKTAA